MAASRRRCLAPLALAAFACVQGSRRQALAPGSLEFLGVSLFQQTAKLTLPALAAPHSENASNASLAGSLLLARKTRTGRSRAKVRATTWAEFLHGGAVAFTGSMAFTPFCFCAIVLVVASLVWQLAPISHRNSAACNDALPAPAAPSSEPLAVVLNRIGAVRVLAAAALYVGISWLLIKYNEYLMQPGRFPFAVNLSFGHQLSGSLILFLFYKLRPDAFSSISAVRPSSRFIILNVLPIAVFFSGQLVLSNCAYKYVSVAFIQMMKEGNMILVYTLCLVVGLETFNALRAQVLFCLFLSTLLTIRGEVEFDLQGLIVQCSGQVMEATKLVLQALLLQTQGGVSLDTLSSNVLVQPCTCALLGIFLVNCYTWLSSVEVASAADYAIWWPHLVANGALALSLNLSIALFLSRSSAVGFIVVGVFKDILIVLGDTLVTGTQLSGLQVVSFAMQCAFLCLYSAMKVCPKRFEEPERCDGKPT